MDAILNARQTHLINTPYTPADTLLDVADADFIDAAADFNLVIYDRTQGSAAEARRAGRFEIVRVSQSDMTPQTLQVTRAREGTSAIEFDAAGDWQVILAPTRKVFVDINAAIEGKVAGNDARLSDSREWSASTVSQAEAQAGSATTRRAWTAQRVRQAIAAFTYAFNPSGNYENLRARATTAADVGAPPTSRSISAGTGLSGGGTLAANRTLSVDFGTSSNTAARGNDARLTNSREWSASTVSQAEAQAGTATTRRAWTAQRVRQAIETLAAVMSASSDTGLVTTPRTRQVNASNSSRASGKYSQINASSDGCVADSDRSQVNTSANSQALQSSTQINSSFATESASGDWNCSIWGYHSNPLSTPTSANRTARINARAGDIEITGQVSSGHNFGDYAEFFENATGQEIQPGVLVKLTGDKVAPAGPGDEAIGVVSATAGMVLGASNFCWHGRYLKDEWGRFLMQQVPDALWQAGENETEEDRPMIPAKVDNPDWNPEQEQIPREDRPDEWTVVGLLGQVLVRVADSVQIGDYVKPGANNVATTSTEKTNLRVMRETQEYDPVKGYQIVLCLLK